METQTFVTQVVADLTRYPLEILTADADFEAELGIDSVKRMEILARLQKHYAIPQTVEVPIRQIRTIAAVTAFIEGVRNGTATAPAEVNGSAEDHAAPPPPAIVVAAPVDAWADGLAWASAETYTNGVSHARNGASATPVAPVRPALVRAPHAEPPIRLNGTHAAKAPRRPTFARADFEGRVVLVTGSGRGLGSLMARRLAKLGARVVVNSFHSRERGDATTREIRAEGGEAEHIWGSVSNEAHLERMFAEIDARFGRLDFVVSNASNGILAPLSEVTEDHWLLSFRTNVIGLHRVAMLAAPLMERGGGGKIVAISSPGADRYIEHFGCQGPVKAAMESLVRYLAVELGPKNIQVNALSAGPLEGELITRYPDADRLIPYWASRTTQGRLGTADATADGVLFLLTADLVNGTTLLMDDAGSLRI